MSLKNLTLPLLVLLSLSAASAQTTYTQQSPVLDHLIDETLQHQFTSFPSKAFDLAEAFMPQNNEFETKVLKFAEGLLDSVGSIEVLFNFQTCLGLSETIYSDLASALDAIDSRDPLSVENGVKLLGKTVKTVLDIAWICNSDKTETNSLVKLSEPLRDFYSFSYHVNKSLQINKIEIIMQVTRMLEAYKSNDFLTVGLWLGKAMLSIKQDLNKKLDPEFAEYLNQVSGWQAEVPEKFENMTFEEIRGRFLGSQEIDYSSLDNLTEFDYEDSVKDIPAYFNCSEQWPGCVHPIRDQGQCGSCWAFAASEVISDRFCVASNGSVQVILSPQNLLSCDKPLSLGCNGGVPLFSWWFIIEQGLVTDSCLPYLAYNGTNPLKCDDFKACQDGSPIQKYYGVNESTVILHNPESIQANMMQYGPIDAAFIVYEDFMYYKGGVYKHSSGKILGLHSVKMTGWGNENGTNYWIVANSWGTSWGEDGFFRIAFGECGIDEATATGRADLSRLPTMSENRFWY